MTSALRNLPRVIPVFPLSGAVLFPHADLPLNIFEPRYLAMVEDAAHGHGIIGMVQPRQGALDREPSLYDVGCAGAIEELEVTDDGRFLICLHGRSRFRIDSECKVDTPYRQVHADYGPFACDLYRDENLPPDTRHRLLSYLRPILDRRKLPVSEREFAQLGDDALIAMLVAAVPFEAAEKQAIIEAVGLAARAEMMTALLKFAMADANQGDRVTRH